MSGYVAFCVEAEIRDRTTLDSVMASLVAQVREAEPGTTHYEWSVSEDERLLFIHERFLDSSAALVHLATFAREAERFGRSVSTVRFRVYGSPCSDLRRALSEQSPEYVTQIAGFSRPART